MPELELPNPAAPGSVVSPGASRRTGSIAAVAGAGVLWGGSAIVIKAGFNGGIDPLTLVQARLALASVLLAAGLAVIAPRLLRLTVREAPRVVVWGCLGLLMVQGGYYCAVALAGVATALFLQYTSPVLTALWERLAARGRLGAGLLAALALCSAGLTALLFGGGAELRLTGSAVLAGALSSLGNVFDAVYGKRVLARLHPATLLLYGMVAAFVATLAVRSPWQTCRDLFPAHAGQVAYVAVGATLVPFLLYLVGLSRLRPVEAMLLALIEPVVGVLGARVFLGEKLTTMQIFGAAGVLAGVIVAQARRGRASDA